MTETLTAEERDELRTIQDQFLALPVVKHWEETYGADMPVAGENTPSVARIRDYLCPEHRELIVRTIADCGGAWTSDPDPL